jgi:hypothetical protein
LTQKGKKLATGVQIVKNHCVLLTVFTICLLVIIYHHDNEILFVISIYKTTGEFNVINQTGINFKLNVINWNQIHCFEAVCTAPVYGNA